MLNDIYISKYFEQQNSYLSNKEFKVKICSIKNDLEYLSMAFDNGYNYTVNKNDYDFNEYTPERRIFYQIEGNSYLGKHTYRYLDLRLRKFSKKYDLFEKDNFRFYEGMFIKWGTEEAFFEYFNDEES